MRSTDVPELIFLAALWGASFLFMRTASPEFGPVALIEMRALIAALSLMPFLLWKRHYVRAYVDNWWPISLVGLTNTAIPFCLFAYSTLYMQAGAASILNATAPMFAAMIAFVWLKDRLSKVALFGLLIGFSGVFVLSAGKQSQQGSEVILPIIAALGAAALYGLAACYSKRYLQGVAPMAVAAGSQISATLFLLPFSIWLWPPVMPSTTAWMQVSVLGFACTGIAYLIYFRLITNVGASNAITVAYLVPVFGVLWGVIFLQETVTINQLAGAGLILLGVSLTTGLIKAKKLKARKE